MDWVLASDIDNTLTGGERKNLDKLTQILTKLRKKKKLYLILSTGRRLDEVMPGFADEGIPVPDAILTQVGTEIYYPPFHHKQIPDKIWDKRLRKNFKRKVAEKFVEHIRGLKFQPERYNTPLKLSVYLNEAPDPDRAAAMIKKKVKNSGLFGYQVIWSSTRDLDIIPKAGGKANAIKFIIKENKLKPHFVIVAGDSGNDATMFSAFENGIAVANSKTELKHYLEKHKKNHYLAKKPYAEGVLEGLCHFKVL